MWRRGHREGKCGGIKEVSVLAISGNGALSGVLQNVIDALRRLSGMDLPPNVVV